jgi:hypothetical protein
VTVLQKLESRKQGRPAGAPPSQPLFCNNRCRSNDSNWNINAVGQLTSEAMNIRTCMKDIMLHGKCNLTKARECLRLTYLIKFEGLEFRERSVELTPGPRNSQMNEGGYPVRLMFRVIPYPVTMQRGLVVKTRCRLNITARHHAAFASRKFPLSKHTWCSSILCIGCP